MELSPTLLRMVALGRHAMNPQRTLAGAVITPDGRSLYVATSKGIWVLDTTTLAVRATFAAGREVSSVALSRDGQRLYALIPEQKNVVALDAANGQTLGRVTANSGAWAIERVLT